VDLGLDNVTSNSLKFTITGYDGTLANPGTAVFTVSGTDNNCCGATGGNGEDWTTYSAAGNVSFQSSNKGTLGPITGINSPIDELVITVTDTVGSGYLDNINLPEGGTAIVFLLLAGGACFGAMSLKPRLAAQ
jgi:hypothetical protein